MAEEIKGTEEVVEEVVKGLADESLKALSAIVKAEGLKIKGYSKMDKPTLVAAIEDARLNPPVEEAKEEAKADDQPAETASEEVATQDAPDF